MSLHMKNKGYNVIGIDLSDEMLSAADFKAKGEISFIKSEMQNFSLAETVDACMCNLDSINHLNDIYEVQA